HHILVANCDQHGQLGGAKSDRAQIVVIKPGHSTRCHSRPVAQTTIFVQGFRSVKHWLRGVHIHYWLDMSRGTSTTSRMKCEPWSKASGLSWRTSCRRRDRRVSLKRAASSETAAAMSLPRGGTVFEVSDGPLVEHPERRMITTDTLVVQNNHRHVICFVCISHQQIGQIVENEPLFVIVDRGDHMIKIVASIVHGHEPNVVCRESSRSSRRILSDGMRFAIAISRRDHFKRTGQVARRGVDQKINRSVEVPEQSFALILASLLDYFHERGYCHTIDVARFVVRFNARVKVGLVEQHLVSKGFPHFNERSFFI